MLKEYKVALIFVGKFLLVYVVANFVYGIFVESFDLVDPITLFVTDQSTLPISWIYDGVEVSVNSERPTAFLTLNEATVISVFEGCNGVNVGIIFLSFIFAYRSPVKSSIIFSLIGLLIIHVANLLRITGLFWVADARPEYLYFIHKYVFTGVIYFVVFLMWILWVRMNKISN